jgi:UDP-2,3-diacylglucosamine pyrophosphatase LpxH
MRTAATEERMFVVSDLHLGNPGSTARSRLVGFLDHARRQRASLCINGDGFDLAQTSFPRLAGDTLPVMAGLRRLLDADLRVYYVVGNHDMVLEHFLSDLVFSQISPFLNVRSGERRIRVEHGHIYDPWFSRAPASYQLATRVAGYLLVAVPDVYRVWDRVGTAVDRRSHRRETQESSAGPVSETRYHRAANDLLLRGFDTVIFGHTHTAETLPLAGGTYINSGNWLQGSTYVDIDNGAATLCAWRS